MAKDMAVFMGEGGVAVVLNVIEVVGGTTMYVTDNIGLTEIHATGSTRRLLAVSRAIARRYNPVLVRAGTNPNWNDLRNY